MKAEKKTKANSVKVDAVSVETETLSNNVCKKSGSVTASKAQKLGFLGLHRTFVTENPVRCVFYIDEDSLNPFSTAAMGSKLTTDELLRHMVWGFNTDKGVKEAMENYLKNVVAGL